MRAKEVIETQEAVSSAIETEKQQIRLNEIETAFDQLQIDHARVQETLLSLDLMLDNRGWTELFGNNVDLWGPNIEQIRYASTQIRELVTVNSHMKRGHLLRANYCWDGNIHYENVGGGRGAGNVNVQKFIDDPINQREFFGSAARKKRSKAEYCDGHAVWVGDDLTKTLKFVDFQKVSGILTNPADPSEIWALRIVIQLDTSLSNPQLEGRWIFLDGFEDKRSARTYFYNGTDEAIEQNKRIFLRRVNETPGWMLGTPDALAAMQWIRMYREYMISGKKMSDAMAMLWGQYRSTATGMQNASVKIGGGNKQSAGQIDVSGGEWNILSTAGKSYDFGPGMTILAAAATALEVSVIDLSSNPGAAGSSYGSAQTLDLPSKIAVAARRAEEAEFDEQVLRWMGAKNPKAWFNSLNSADDIYRMMQTEMFYWTNAGLRSADEQKKAMDQVRGFPVEASQKVPDGVMLPNNTKFAQTLSNDAVPGGAAGSAPSAGNPPTSTTPAPDQGRGNGNGGAGNQGNMRKDTISN